MKISVNDKECFCLSETQKKVIMNDIPSEIFEEDMIRRLKWILLDEKYEHCFERLKKEWEPKLAASGIKSLPIDKDEFANLVFAQPDYKNRSQRQIENEKNINSLNAL
jgi:hypothetical protein